jgi:hypothetical protein
VESEAQSETSLAGLSVFVCCGEAGLGSERVSVCIILAYYAETNSRERDMAAGGTGDFKPSQSKGLGEWKGEKRAGK